MSIFRYQAVDFQGKRLSGIVEAKDEITAGEIIEEKGLSVVSVSLVKENGMSIIFRRFFSFSSRISRKEIVIFLRQLSVLISSNVPIAQALKAMTRSTKSVSFKIIISAILDEVEGGNKLSEAIGRHPEIFGDFYVNLIRAGETSGRLSEVLIYLADKEERDYDLTRKIRGMLIYPIFIFFSLIIVVSIMMVAVIPKLTAVLAESNVDLPWSTKLLVSFSDFFSQYWYFLFSGLFIIVMGVYFYIRKSHEGRVIWDMIKIKLPVAQNLYRAIYIVRFSQSLSILLKGGVDMVTALNISSSVVGNELYREFILLTAKKVEDGSGLSEAMTESDFFPPMVYQMVEVGEKSGQIDGVLSQISVFYSKEATAGIGELIGLIEPIIIIFMGISVGIVISAVIMPMYKLAGAV